MEASKKEVKVAVSTGIQHGCTLVVSDAKILCMGGGTPQLGDSIHTTIKESTHKVIGKVGTKRGEGVDVEYGTQSRVCDGISPNEASQGITAQPFLRPALYANEGKIINHIKKEVGKILK